MKIDAHFVDHVIAPTRNRNTNVEQTDPVLHTVLEHTQTIKTIRIRKQWQVFEKHTPKRSAVYASVRSNNINNVIALSETMTTQTLPSFMTFSKSEK